MECPHRNELIQLNRDDLPSDRSESLFDHLDICPQCATVFGQLAESTNSLGEHLAAIPQKDIKKARIDKSRFQKAQKNFEQNPGIDEPVASAGSGLGESQYALLPGQKFEKYKILRLLDSGGMGEVYEAQHSVMDRHVAIKVIRGRHQDNPIAYQKFLQEMKTLVRVEHPNLVRALDGGDEDGSLFVVMELLDGDTLHTLCVERKIGSVVEIIDAMLGTCRGLEKLHAHQLLHRDIKPANIMRLKDGTIKVIDLGLAADNIAGRQMSHVGAGTQGYMPPEQTYGSDSLDERSDIFSAGRVLNDLLKALRDAQPNSNQTNAVSKLETLAEWMTKLEMEGRPQSVKEVIVELRKLRRATGQSTRRRQTRSGPATAPPAAKERKRLRILATPGVWIAAALVVTVMIVLAVWPDSSPAPSNAKTDQPAGLEIGLQAPPAAIAPFDAVQAKTHQTTWADHLGVPVETTNSIGMKFILIPPGRFTMGIQPEESETIGTHSGSAKPAHEVTILNSAYFGVHEVTESQWSAVAESSAASGINNQHPVNGVSWFDATAFCRALSDRPEEKSAGRIYRLPTEAEWEYVCRAGTTGPYFWGRDPTRSEAFAWTSANSGTHTHPVGQKTPNPWGVFDMHGNLWEWCQDWYGAYPIQSPSGPKTGKLRIQRGGCFNSQVLRSTFRNMNPPDLKHPLHGLRLVLNGAVSSTSPLSKPDSPATNPIAAVEQGPWIDLLSGNLQSQWRGSIGTPKEQAGMSSSLRRAAQQRADSMVRKHWKLSGGVLSYDGHPEGHNLSTIREFRNFELSLEWKIAEGGDTGIYLRGLPQVQIWDPNSPKELASRGSGGLFNNESHSNVPMVRMDRPVGNWNEMSIRLIDEKVSVELNGQRVVDSIVMENFDDRSQPLYPEGPIELQKHTGPSYFRSIQVRELFPPKHPNTIGATTESMQPTVFQDTPVTSNSDQKTSQLRPSLQMLAELVADSPASIAISSDGKTVYWDRNGFTWSATRDDLSAGSTFRNAQEWIGGRHLTLAGDVGVLLIKEPNRNFETLHEFTVKNGMPSRPGEISTLVPDSGRVYSPHLSSNGNVLCFAGRFNGSLPQLYYSKRSTSGLWPIAQPLLRDSQLTDGWTGPSLLDDGKVLLTTNQGEVVRDNASRYPHNIFIARRTSVNQPFTRTELIELPGISSLWFQSPRYLPETGELFVLVQPRSEVGTPTWKPAVIRGVRLSER